MMHNTHIALIIFFLLLLILLLKYTCIYILLNLFIIATTQ